MRRTFKDYNKKEKVLFLVAEAFWVLSLLLLWFSMKNHDLVFVVVIGFAVGLVCMVLLHLEGAKVQRASAAAKEAAKQAEEVAKQKEIISNYNTAMERVIELTRQYADEGASEAEAFKAAEQFLSSSEGKDLRSCTAAYLALLLHQSTMLHLQQLAQQHKAAELQRQQERAETEEAAKRQADLQAKAILDRLESRSHNPYFKQRMRDLTGGK